ncbi:hypothetical protein L6R29_00200 [Myxococcota bacterium]|nr:hypothetical protein [Myxococcota bacterium]
MPRSPFTIHKPLTLGLSAGLPPPLSSFRFFSSAFVACVGFAVCVGRGLGDLFHRDVTCDVMVFK